METRHLCLKRGTEIYIPSAFIRSNGKHEENTANIVTNRNYDEIIVATKETT